MRAVFFQFPLSERTNCNLFIFFPLFEFFQSFSFLYRNERTATDFRYEMEDASHFAFSFLYRNERTATLKNGIGENVRKHLSVSSIGTNELQQTNSVGTKPTKSSFQFPLSERTNCNSGYALPYLALTDFQFPLSERTNCNIP